jgi:very-short-patch-repair endonuclease
MRANPTEAEKRLWSMLRDRRFGRYKFRRQQIIDFYIVDFVSLSERLIIEADGSHHAESEVDLRRDEYLRSQGFHVLRFSNNEILREPDAVKSAILAALSIPHPPKPKAWGTPTRERGLEIAMPDTCDLIVLGSGPGRYVASIPAETNGS